MVRSPTKHKAGEIDQSQLASSVFLSTEQQHIQYHQLRPAQRTQRRLPDQLWASIAWHPYLLSSFSTFGRCREGSSLSDLVLFNMTPGADTPCPCFTLDDDDEDVVEVISAAAASLTIVPLASDASWGVAPHHASRPGKLAAATLLRWPSPTPPRLLRFLRSWVSV